MNKYLSACLIFAGGVLLTFSARAFDVPAYIEDPQNVSGNIDIIIKENTAPRTDSATAQELSKKLNDTINEYATRLYAEALSISASMSDDDNKTGVTKVVSDLLSSIGGSSDKKQILQNDVKANLKNIAVHVKQLMELEAGIANLQGVQLLSGLEMPTEDDAEDK